MKVRVRGVELHLDVEGDGDPVVFLHGYPLSGRLWDPAVRALRDGYRCIVPDLRGFGMSGATPRADMATYADDFADLLDALGEHRPVALVSLSMGGYVAFEIVRRHPTRVRALALVDTRAGPDTPDAARARRETAARVLREGVDFVADEMAAKLFARSADPGLRAEWRGIMAATPPVGAAAALLAMADRPDSRSTLGELDARGTPVLIVVGEEDAITPPDEARRMQDACPSATLAVIPGAGHMTPVERPGEFIAILRDFLA